MKIGAVRGDITTVDCEAIVNAANSSLLGGGGVDGAIHRAAGPQLLVECRAIVARQGGCDPGQAVITGAGELTADYVIHTVGPVWQQEQAVELDEVLADCYRNSIRLAVEQSVRSIAFPCISTGVYRYPKRRAAEIATVTVREIIDALDPMTTLERILFVCFEAEDEGLYRELV